MISMICAVWCLRVQVRAEFTIVREGREIDLLVTPMTRYSEALKINIGLLGVRSIAGGERERMLPGSALITATSDAFHMSLLILRGLARLGSGQMQSGEIQGPVGIAKISGSALQQGIVPFILLTAIISINLGLINLLPVPALDGGHLAFSFMITAANHRRWQCRCGVGLLS